ncbi:MAG TPA: response regulator [Bryobacteraceae bacterium]|nr:response regulator [Bryobacteraceae bacterium]
MKRVLIADDNPVSRELIREILENDDYEVIEAGNGREALEKLREHQPDLALLDIQMPVLDGNAVIREVRADSRFSRLPVAALTAYAMQGDREKALALGFNAYITKPIDISAFRSEVARLLGNSPD